MYLSKFEQVEHLTKALAHLNCALEHLDHVPLNKLFTFTDKQKMKAFMHIAETKASKYIEKSYENDEEYFQLLQNALSGIIEKPVKDLINGEIQRLPKGDNIKGVLTLGEDGDVVPSDGGKDGKNPDSPRDSSGKKS